MGYSPSVNIVAGTKVGDWWDWRAKTSHEYELPAAVKEQLERNEENHPYEPIIELDGLRLEEVWQGIDGERVAFGHVLFYAGWDIELIDIASFTEEWADKVAATERAFAELGIEREVNVLVICNYS